MGDEISQTYFEPRDYERYTQRLRDELDLLKEWEATQRFAGGEPTFGLELEAWLLDADARPVAENDQFLESVVSEAVVPELAKFNFELNVTPRPVAGNGLAEMRGELARTWQMCGERAAQLGRRITIIGCLPTVTAEMLCIQNMTSRSRFATINRQVFRMRRGEPLHVEIEGLERLELDHHDVMLEAAATSLQVHLKIPLPLAVRYYNAAILASPFTVAMAANAPLLFGKRLWHDTRIAIFEQAVDTGHPYRRVSFDLDYAADPFLGVFEDKVDLYPVLLPVPVPQPPHSVPHLRLHNGTIWTWNRPLIGFEDDGQPHVRIEHRVMSAGPTLDDTLANTALALGLIEYFAAQPEAPEFRMPFPRAKENFYAAARYGLGAEISWFQGKTNLGKLLEAELLPHAMSALRKLGVDGAQVEANAELLRGRVSSGQTGAAWQLRAFERHGGDVAAVLEEYLEQQSTLRPVHQWPIG
jgi:gamma-glutamyl:cysteine ligase YbdK (ATP-grasp superfamily)